MADETALLSGVVCARAAGHEREAVLSLSAQTQLDWAMSFVSSARRERDDANGGLESSAQCANRGGWRYSRSRSAVLERAWWC